MNQDFSDLRGEMNQRLSDVQSEIGDVRTDMNQQLTAVRDEISKMNQNHIDPLNRPRD